MNAIQKFALGYIIAVVLLAYGYAVGRFEVFPYELLETLVQDYEEFERGDLLERESTVVAKLKSDLGLSFDRFLYTYPKRAAADAKKVEFPTFAGREDNPLVYVDENHQSGYRVMVGALDLAGAFWGGLLLDETGRPIHTWNLSTEHLPTNQKKDHMKILYGVHVFADGSVIFGMHEIGGGIVKVDACSNVVWNLEGEYHHVVSPDEEGFFWSFVGSQKAFDQDIVKISVETGEVVQTIAMADVRAANPKLHIWNLQAQSFFDREFKQRKIDGDITHGNDIEPLPTALQPAFPMFEAGDLAISYATTNLVFVLDPATLEVKWWRIGISDTHHDPDWEEDGRIGLYSNNRRVDLEWSDIVAIDPADMAWEVVIDGQDHAFQSNINGRHQKTAYGTRMVTSAQQGWVFEVDSAGKQVFSFVNNVSQKRRKAMHMAEAWRYDEEYFSEPFWESCQ